MESKKVSSGKAITNTNISYKLAKIPVSISTMVDKVDGVSLKGLCPHCKDKNGIGNVATCKGCSTVFTGHGDKSLLKTYNFSKEDQLIISAEQRENLKNFDKRIRVQGTIPMEKIDYRNFTGGYYLTPQKDPKKTSKTNTVKAYLTFYEGLRLTNMAMVVKYSVKSKQNLGLIIAYFDEVKNTKCLVLKELCYGEQLREYDIEYDEEQIPNSEDEQAGMSFVNRIDPINPQEIENDFTKMFEEILKNPEKVELETKVEEESAMDMFAI